MVIKLLRFIALNEVAKVVFLTYQILILVGCVRKQKGKKKHP